MCSKCVFRIVFNIFAGPYLPGCIDIMLGYTNTSQLLRLYYPTNSTKSEKVCRYSLSFYKKLLKELITLSISGEYKKMDTVATEYTISEGNCKSCYGSFNTCTLNFLVGR